MRELAFSLTRELIKVRRTGIEKQTEFQSPRPPDSALYHKNIGRILCGPDTQPKMRTGFHGHAARDSAPILMHVDDAALSHEFTTAIKDAPYQRTSRLTASVQASGHVSSVRQVHTESMTWT
jgi:hypothetical protein